jgi:serine phosphatase RsbU (regulator of sigma subunit)
MKPHGHYVLPVRWEDEMLGVFTLYIADGAPYSERTMGFLRMVADAIAKRIMLHRQKERLEEQLREIRASHRAAAGLMQALVPAPELLHNRFPGVQALWYQPSTEVGGDFYFFYEKGRSVYFGVGDAEGHGVVGAILAGVLISEIHNLLYTQGEIRPAELIRMLHQRLLRIYGDAEAILRSGADLAVCQYDREQRVLRYAGARIPLLYSTNGKIEILEPVPAAIGTERMEKRQILDTELAVRPGLRLYLMSDGPAFQLGGGSTETLTKFGRRRLYKILEQTSQLPLPEQLQKVQAAIRQWQGTAPQTDDITLWILEPAGE